MDSFDGECDSFELYFNGYQDDGQTSIDNRKHVETEAKMPADVSDLRANFMIRCKIGHLALYYAP